jgi:hypothetical protein
MVIESNGGKAMEIIDERFMVCTDCISIIANDDASSFDYYYGDKADEREAEVRKAINETEGHIVPGDSENDQEFSWNPCDCCGSNLAGSRFQCAILSS